MHSSLDYDFHNTRRNKHTSVQTSRFGTPSIKYSTVPKLYMQANCPCRSKTNFNEQVSLNSCGHSAKKCPKLK